MNNTPDEITVTIPHQTYDPKKYNCVNQRCYLEEALDKAGFTNLTVRACGETKIGNVTYSPKEIFCGTLLRTEFERGNDVVVTLVKDKSIFWCD